MSEVKTRDSIQLSYGRLVDWEMQNPVLLPGEIACVLDSDTLEPIDLRFGNGYWPFKNLPSLVNNDRVYTKEEMEEILNVIRKSIETANSAILTCADVQAQFQEKIEGMLPEGVNAEDNKLQAVKDVLEAIERAVATRFGRILYADAEGNKFRDGASVGDGPWFYQGVNITELETGDPADKAPKKGDLAEVEGEKYDYIYMGPEEGWQQQVGALLPDQLKSLNSGITSDKVAAYDKAVGDIEDAAEQAAAAEAKAQENEKKLLALTGTEDIPREVAHKIGAGIDLDPSDGIDTVNDVCYVNTATVTEGQAGTNYLQGAECYINVYGVIFPGQDDQRLHGFITKVDESGGIQEVFLEHTKVKIPDAPYMVTSEQGGSGAEIHIVSEKKLQDLWETKDYLKTLIDKHQNAVMHAGPHDGELKAIQDGKYVSLFHSPKIVYVDRAVVESGTGIEVSPYKTIEEAISYAEDNSGTTVLIAAGEYSDRILSSAISANVNFVGYSVGGNSSVSVADVSITAASDSSVSVGLRDITVRGHIIFNSVKRVYLDNVTVNGSITLSDGGEVYLSHCSFGGLSSTAVNMSGEGILYLDCCQFEKGTVLEISRGATVYSEGCSGMKPHINDAQSSYIQYTGACYAKNESEFAADFSTAKFVGLFGGVALTPTNKIAPITISGNVQRYSLGTFVFDRVNSAITQETNREDIDGLSGNQVSVRTTRVFSDTPGYTLSDGVRSTLEEHLRAISDRLYSIAGEPGKETQQAGVVTTITLKTGGTQGSVALEYTLSDGTTKRSGDIKVQGLGTAAYKAESYFAKATDVSSLSSTVTTLSGTVSKHSSDIESLKSKDTQLSGKIDSVESTANQASSTAQQAATDASKASTDVTKLTGRVETLEEWKNQGGGGGGSSSGGGSASSEELQALTRRVTTLERNAADYQLISNKSTGDLDTGDNTRYPSVAAVAKAINSATASVEKTTNKKKTLGTNSGDETGYPTVGAVLVALTKYIPTSRLPESDNSTIVTEQSFRTLSTQRTLIPNQTAYSDERDIFGSIQILNDSGNTRYYDLTGVSGITVATPQNGDNASYFAWMYDGDSIAFAHNGAPSGHSNVIQSPTRGDYYIDISAYESKAREAVAETDEPTISNVLYQYTTDWGSVTISGRQFNSISRAQGKAQYGGNGWIIVDSPSQSFTRAQMAAINSKITSELVEVLSGKAQGSSTTSSITDLPEKSVYDAITGRVKLTQIPTSAGSTTLLMAPSANTGTLGTYQLTEATNITYNGTDHQKELPSVQTVRAMIAGVETAVKESVDTTYLKKTEAASTYQKKITGRTGQLLVGTDGDLPEGKNTISKSNYSNMSSSSHSGDIPTAGAVSDYVSGQVSGLRTDVSGAKSDITDLKGQVKNLQTAIEVLKPSSSGSPLSDLVTNEALWGNNGGPKEGDFEEGDLLAYKAENGHLQATGVKASSLSGVKVLPFTSTGADENNSDGSSDLADGVLYVPAADLEERNGSVENHVWILPAATAGKKEFANVAFRPIIGNKNNSPWGFDTFLLIVHTDEPRKLSQKQDTIDTVKFTNCYLPISLKEQDQISTNNLSFVSSTVFLYAEATGVSNYIASNESSAYAFEDSTVYIAVDDSSNDNNTFVTFNNIKLRNCTVHIYGNVELDELKSEIENCTFYLHESRRSKVMPKITTHNNGINMKGSLFITDATTAPEALSTLFTCFWRSDKATEQQFRTNLMPSGVRSELDEIKKFLVGQSGDIGSVSASQSGHINEKLQFGGDGTPQITLSGPHISETISVAVDNVPNSLSTDGIKSTTKLDFLGGGSTSVGQIVLGNGAPKFVSLNSIVLPDTTTTSGTKTLKSYLDKLEGTGSGNGVAYAESAKSASTSSDYTGTVTVTVSPSRTSNTTTNAKTVGDNISVKVGSATASSTVKIDTVDCATAIMVQTESTTTWQRATISTHTITENDWTS